MSIKSTAVRADTLGAPININYYTIGPKFSPQEHSQQIRVSNRISHGNISTCRRLKTFSESLMNVRQVIENVGK